MYWNRQFITKRMIIQNVDGEEEYNVEHPSPNRDTIGFNKKWRSFCVKLGQISCESHKYKLNECEKCTF